RRFPLLRQCFEGIVALLAQIGALRLQSRAPRAIGLCARSLGCDGLGLLELHQLSRGRWILAQWRLLASIVQVQNRESWATGGRGPLFLIGTTQRQVKVAASRLDGIELWKHRLSTE